MTKNRFLEVVGLGQEKIIYRVIFSCWHTWPKWLYIDHQRIVVADETLNTRQRFQSNTSQNISPWSPPGPRGFFLKNVLNWCSCILDFWSIRVFSKDRSEQVFIPGSNAEQSPSLSPQSNITFYVNEIWCSIFVFISESLIFERYKATIR